MLLTRRNLLKGLHAAALAPSPPGTRNGWITIRLEGDPAEIGYQHGQGLAPEIDDAIRVSRLGLEHGSARLWSFYRDAVQTVLWPRIEEEYRAELKGIADGMKARGYDWDVWDIVVHNANIELNYYTAMLERRKASAAPDRCSAFVATGSATRDGKIVMGHNNWSGYLEGARWNVIFDIRPKHGHRMLMDGVPGLIHSGDDFGINSAGLAITETTITQFFGFDPQGRAEFVRARKAMQYAANINDFDRLMREGNNGGYANTWLVGDLNRNEIGRLELGLKNITLDRKTDGAYVGANFPINRKLTAQETNFAANDLSLSANARRVRWEQLMRQHHGQIDLAAGKRFLADHYDTFTKTQNAPSERTLCGHIDLSSRGLLPWQQPHGPAGAVQSKVTDAALAGAMSFEAALGHSCGIAFKAGEFLAHHPEFNWQKDLLKDLPSQPWTRFHAGA